MTKSKNRSLTICLGFFVLCFLLLSKITYGRVKEKTIQWNSTTGHVHGGVNDGKKIDGVNVVFSPTGDIAAFDVQAAIGEVDLEKIPLTQRGAVNGVATLDASGTIPTGQIPALAFTTEDVCADEICQLALVAEEGDVCIRSDLTKSFIHNGGVAGTMADWTELEAVGLVNSVNGQTGIITGMEETVNRQTTITDNDSKYPSSGAVVDYLIANPPAHSSTTGRTTDDHHDDMSDAYNITPATVTTTGNMKINSDAIADKLLFGTVGDTNLYRLAANTLKTDDSFDIGGNLSVALTSTFGTAVFGNVTSFNRSGSTETTQRHYVAGDTFDRLSIYADGSLNWGSGSAATDVSLYRISTNLAGFGDGDGLRLREYLEFSESSSTAGIINSWVSGGSNPYLQIRTDGLTEWGSGSAAVDTNLYRSAANTLKTDDNFVVGGALTVGGDAGTIQHATTTKYYSYGPQQAQPYGTNPIVLEFNQLTAGATGSQFYYALFPVNLPSGGIITQLDMWGVTQTNFGTITTDLYRSSLSSISADLLASISISSGGSAGTDSTISSATIDNSAYAYFMFIGIKVTSGGTLGITLFEGARVTLTVTKLSQTQ